MCDQLADIIEQFGADFIKTYQPNSYQMVILDALLKCRTAAFGGHKYHCSNCGKNHICYNSCRNRHCPKCQGAKQAFWVENRMERAYQVKHFHMVFTVPEALNTICLLDSRWFYNHLFACVWDTLQSFGYSHYKVETGAMCVLHTWGQNLSLHPHLHCLVPAAGKPPIGSMKYISKGGKYLYPVKMLSAAFKGKFMTGLKKHLQKAGLYSQYHHTIQKVWNKPWVVFCEPSFGNPDHVIKYLGQYVHRVAISNYRILKVDQKQVTFRMKDYRDGSTKSISMAGSEFLRRFCMHILPKRFVKIRYYGIYSTRFTMMHTDKDKMVIKPPETKPERILRLMKVDVHRCPHCKKGQLKEIEIIPRIRSPGIYQLALK
jgi:hypothetical protein